MKRLTNILIQVLVTITQVANILNPFMSEDMKLVVAVFLAVTQGLTSIIAHEFNPDGTPAQVPWEK